MDFRILLTWPRIVLHFDRIRGKTITFDWISITNDKRLNSKCVLYMQFLSRTDGRTEDRTLSTPPTQTTSTIFYLIIFVCFTVVVVDDDVLVADNIVAVV